ncbi:MAG: NAD(P)H-dependent oxidoreductase [Pseudomonadota bacterium]
MNMLFFAGSLRADSANKKFARAALRVATDAGATGEFLDLRDYAMPPYDGDIEAAGLPDTVKQLSAKIAAADALVIATPEYNGSIPGILKNVIDWLSRDKPMALAGKHLLLLAASPGALGGVRGLWHSRVPFEAVGVHVFPGMMGLGGAYAAFDDSGKLKDEKQHQQLTSLIEQYIKHIG